MTRLNCQKCAGEGTIYTSRYGGNDPDVYPVGKCEACDGSGDQVCEARGCSERAIVFNLRGLPDGMANGGFRAMTDNAKELLALAEEKNAKYDIFQHPHATKAG